MNDNLEEVAKLIEKANEKIYREIFLGYVNRYLPLSVGKALIECDEKMRKDKAKEELREILTQEPFDNRMSCHPTSLFLEFLDTEFPEFNNMSFMEFKEMIYDLANKTKS